jgi:cellulose synthase/poly-beta-1,6-N-acetylglucosamine synthase-like glycosyltransferase
MLCQLTTRGRRRDAERWFLRAFAPVLNPTVCLMLSVGTLLSRNSLYTAWKSFDIEPDRGFATMLVAPSSSPYDTYGSFEPLLAFQRYEYYLRYETASRAEQAIGMLSSTTNNSEAIVFRYTALNIGDDGSILPQYLDSTSPTSFYASLKAFSSISGAIKSSFLHSEPTQWTTAVVLSRAQMIGAGSPVEFAFKTQREFLGDLFTSLEMLRVSLLGLPRPFRFSQLFARLLTLFTIFFMLLFRIFALV